MIIVGLTGGIGSGKTTVAKLFKALGIPIYIADVEAKRMMTSSKVIKRRLIKLFGDTAYIDGQLNKAFIASKIYNDESLLNQMNAIVHPKVSQDFKKWLNKQHAPYVIKEAAIIFEHQRQAEYDLIITVTAPVEDKIARILKRDRTTRSKIIQVINNQLSDEEKMKKSDFVIYNNTLKNTQSQVLKTHQKIMQIIEKPF